jgi:phage tail sheath protein FI
MLNLQTPGVYLREIESPPPPLLKMSVTGFVGQAERGPLNSPQLIENLGQFRDIFGDLIGYSYLPYSIFGFFLNGGERCYVVRVAHESAVKAALEQTASPLIQIEAINEGSWGNYVTVQIDSRSTRDIVLTELAEAVDQNAAKAKFKSVAGLAKDDAVTLVHNRDPIREPLTIKKIDAVTREVAFTEKVSSPLGFPTGSGVIGRGFRLVFRFRPPGKLVREEVFDNVSMNPDSASYFASAINGDPELIDYVLRMKNGNSILVRAQDLNKVSPVSSSRPETLVEKNLEKGVDDPSRVTAPHLTGYEPNVEKYFRPNPPAADEATQKAAAERFNGLAAFELVNEIGLIAIPDLIIPDFYKNIPAPQIPKSGVIFARKQARTLKSEQLNNFRAGQTEMLRHCARMGDRSAILDSPAGAETGKGANRIEDWPGDYQMLPLARYGALYYPWIREKAADFKGVDLTLPPSGHIAGIFARTENRVSVGHAPANEVLHGVVELEFCLSDAEQAILNPRGVNCLRSFPGRGLLVWGARTISAEPAWRYVNVVRVMLATIKQILINLRWTVFEPNDQMLWDKIVATLTLFLRDLFLRGVLAGAKPEEAFFVKCDEETNPPEVIDRGEVITRVGLAPARPAEFIVVTIKRTSESVSVSEGLAGRR